MRPIPVAAGFQACRPGSVSRAANPGSSAIARRDTVRAMPLAVTDLTNSRREILIVPHLSLPERLASRVRHAASRRPARCLIHARRAYFTFSHTNVRTLILPVNGLGGGAVARLKRSPSNL